MSTNTETKTNETASTQTASLEDKLPSFARALADVGQSWVAMGLSVGKNALEHTATALQNTAKALATMADEVTPKSAPSDTPAK